MQGKPEEWSIDPRAACRVMDENNNTVANTAGSDVRRDIWEATAVRIVALPTLERRLASYEAALREIATIANQPDGGDWDEIEQAREIAKYSIAAAGGTNAG